MSVLIWKIAGVEGSKSRGYQYIRSDCCLCRPEVFGVDPQQAYQATKQVTAGQQVESVGTENQRPSSKKPQILSGLFLLIPKTPAGNFSGAGKIIPLLNWSCSVAWLIHVVVLHRRQWGHFIVQLTKSLHRYQFL